MFAAGALDVSIGIGVAPSVRFADAGTAVSLSMTGGTATVEFDGDGLAQSQAGGDVVVSGMAVTISRIAATATSRRSSLTVSASGGDGRVTIGGISADGPLKRITAPNAVLTGAASTGGPVGQLQLLRAENANDHPRRRPRRLFRRSHRSGRGHDP